MIKYKAKPPHFNQWRKLWKEVRLWTVSNAPGQIRDKGGAATNGRETQRKPSANARVSGLNTPREWNRLKREADGLPTCHCIPWNSRPLIMIVYDSASFRLKSGPKGDILLCAYKVLPTQPWGVLNPPPEILTHAQARARTGHGLALALRPALSDARHTPMTYGAAETSAACFHSSARGGKAVFWGAVDEQGILKLLKASLRQGDKK